MILIKPEQPEHLLKLLLVYALKKINYPGEIIQG
jgi:hypothetical protein